MSDIIDLLNNKKQIVCHVVDKEFEMSIYNIIDSTFFFKEYCHDYIQWLFPLNEKSAFNFFAPILSDSDIQQIKESKIIRSNIIEATESMLNFYGFRFSGNYRYSIERKDNFNQYTINWLTENNHNFFRITRILKFLNLIGLHDLASSWHEQLSIVYNENKNIVSKEIFDFWMNAAKEIK